MPDLKKMLTLEALSEALPSWLKRSTKPEYNADEIDSTLTTNQFVTASDKDNWNAKGTYSKPSGGIPKSDLSSIVQASLEKADSALQSETDPTVPSWAKQTNKPSYTQDEVADGSTYKRVTQTEKNTWNGKQNALTTPQMRAVNSGITSEKVTQISTNQTNILYALETGANNLLDLSNATMVADSSLTVTKDGNSYVVSGNPSTSVQVTFTDFVPCVPITGGKIAVVGCPSGGSTSDGYSLRGYFDNSWRCTDFGSDTKEFTTGSINKIVLYFVGGHQYTNVRFTPMVVSEEVWNTLGSDYRPPALPNYDLTRLEAEDRASLVEVVDSGAKNLWANGTSGTISGWRETFQIGQTLKAGTYVIYFDSLTSTDTDANTCQIIAINGTTQVSNSAQCPRGNKVYTILEISADANALWIYSSNSSGTGGDDTATFTNGMICTKAAFGVSQKFVPYRYDPYTTVWQNLANATLYARRNGRTVTINGYVDNLSFTSGTALTLGTINDEIGKPVQQIRALCNIGSNAYSIGEVAYLTVGTDGQLKVTPKTYSGTGAVFLSFAYAF